MHYYAKTTYRANYFYWFIYALSILASLFYFVVRIVYIATGRPGPKIPVNLTIESGGRNVTVGNLLDEVVLSDPMLMPFEIGDEIPESVLNLPEFSELRQAVDDETYRCALPAPGLATNAFDRSSLPRAHAAARSQHLHPGMRRWAWLTEALAVQLPLELHRARGRDRRLHPRAPLAADVCAPGHQVLPAPPRARREAAGRALPLTCFHTFPIVHMVGMHALLQFPPLPHCALYPVTCTKPVVTTPVTCAPPTHTARVPPRRLPHPAAYLI